MPDISVVVPTFNRQSLLKKCIRSLLEQDYANYEVIVVNDGSTDGTAEYLTKLRDRRLVIISQRNKGYGAARNAGFSRAKGRIIASTDDDCVAGKDWLHRIAIQFSLHPEIDAVGGSIVNPTDKKIAWAQYILNYSSWFPAGRERLVKDIPTANIAYRKSSIANLKYRPMGKNAGYSDTMFNLNLKRILFDPMIRVYHHRWDVSNDEDEFISIQLRKARGFASGGYRAHFMGRKLKWINLLCPRLVLILLRCIRAGYPMEFFRSLRLLIRGELAFARAVIRYGKGGSR